MQAQISGERLHGHWSSRYVYVGARGFHYTYMLAGVAAFKINKKKRQQKIYFKKLNNNGYILANIFTMEKLVVKISFGFVNRFSIFYGF